MDKFKITFRLKEIRESSPFKETSVTVKEIAVLPDRLVLEQPNTEPRLTFICFKDIEWIKIELL